MLLERQKMAPDRVPAVLSRLQRDAEQQKLWMTLVGAGSLAAFAALFLAALALAWLSSSDAPMVCVSVGWIPPCIALFVYLSRQERMKRKLLKVRFFADLYRLLADDLHPTKKVRFSFDLRHYDEADKRTWSGRSSAGNAKHKYSDKWLRLAAVLADGSEVRIVRQAGIKTKKGSIQGEKRRLFLTIAPNPRLYAPPKDVGALKGRLEQAVRASFADPPEELHVHVTPQDGSYRVRVTQHDAPIHPAEVTALVGATLRYLALYRRT